MDVTPNDAGLRSSARKIQCVCTLGTGTDRTSEKGWLLMEGIDEDEVAIVMIFFPP